MHLYDVISKDLEHLEFERAEEDISSFFLFLRGGVWELKKPGLLFSFSTG